MSEKNSLKIPENPKILILGGGAWGTAFAISTCKSATIWLFEENYNGSPLTEIINKERENVKYLPGIPIPQSISFVSKITEPFDILVVALPHQFIKPTFKSLSSSLNDKLKNVIIISLTKGFVDENCTLPSTFLGQFGRVFTLMGPNIADEVGHGLISCATMGGDGSDELIKIFANDKFRISQFKCAKSVEMCGVIKNPYAIGFGIILGFIKKNCHKNTNVNLECAYFSSVIKEFKKVLEYFDCNPDVLFEMCGISDLLVTCKSGRNMKCGIEGFNTKKWDENVQGVITLKYLIDKKKIMDKEHKTPNNGSENANFPILEKIYQICYQNDEPGSLLELVN